MMSSCPNTNNENQSHLFPLPSSSTTGLLETTTESQRESADPISNTVLFYCKLCNVYSTQYRHLLLLHIISHDGVKTDACPICPIKFRDRASFDLHVLLHWGNGTTPDVQRRGDDVTLVDFVVKRKCLITGNYNLPITAPGELFDCGLCQTYTCTDGIEMVNHLLQHNGTDSGYSCPLCVHYFRNRKKLTNHARAHLGNGREITEGSSVESTANDEIWSIIENSNFVCHICHASISLRFDLASHFMAMHYADRRFCYLCDRIYYWQYVNSKNAARAILQGLRYFIPSCTICSGSFVVDPILELLSNPDQSQLVKKLYKCTFCELKFLHRNDFADHLIEMHKDTKEICRTCVVVCSKFYDVHQDGDRINYFFDQCSNCHGSFLTSSSETVTLKEVPLLHITTDLNCPPIECRLCAHSCLIRIDLAGHLLKMHKGNSSVCFQCTEKYEFKWSKPIASLHVNHEFENCDVCAGTFFNYFLDMPNKFSGTNRSVSQEAKRSFMYQHYPRFQCSLDECELSWGIEFDYLFHLAGKHRDHRDICKNCVKAVDRKVACPKDFESGVLDEFHSCRNCFGILITRKERVDECPMCKLKIENSKNLVEHLVDVHCQKLVCPVPDCWTRQGNKGPWSPCTKKLFICRAYLIRHINRSLGYKDFVCPCGLRFSASDKLHRHRTICKPWEFPTGKMDRFRTGSCGDARVAEVKMGLVLYADHKEE